MFVYMCIINGDLLCGFLCVCVCLCVYIYRDIPSISSVTVKSPDYCGFWHQKWIQSSRRIGWLFQVSGIGFPICQQLQLMKPLLGAQRELRAQGEDTLQIKEKNAIHYLDSPIVSRNASGGSI